MTSQCSSLTKSLSCATDALMIATFACVCVGVKMQALCAAVEEWLFCVCVCEGLWWRPASSTCCVSFECLSGRWGGLSVPGVSQCFALHAAFPGSPLFYHPPSFLFSLSYVTWHALRPLYITPWLTSPDAGWEMSVRPWVCAWLQSLKIEGREKIAMCMNISIMRIHTDGAYKQSSGKS